MIANIAPFFDPATSTVSYIVYDKAGGNAAIVDPVLDYNAKSGRTHTHFADQLIDYVNAHHLQVEWLLETHAHADHLSASHYLKEKIGGKIAIGERICQVQQVFKDIFNLGEAFPTDGRQFDHLFKEDEIFYIGSLKVQAMFVPGHTPADVAYHIRDNIFLGDTLFMPDVGTARCDFPGGDVNALYQSIQRILSFPENTKLYMCHDYPPETRSPAWVCTVKDQKAHNIHVNVGKTKAEFIQMRTARDKTLEVPTLLLPSIQVNIRAGEFPEVESNGVHYLKIPLNLI